MSGNKAPESPSAAKVDSGEWAPWDTHPDMAAARLANQTVENLGTPSIVNNTFAARYAIFSALNHSPANKTGYDCTLRLAVYKAYERNTVNILGVYFHQFWAYLMKPKYVIQGLANSPGEEDKPGILDRLLGKKKDTAGAQPNGK